MLTVRAAPMTLVAFYVLIGSVSAQFATVINVPPSIAPAQILANTQLNLYDGGALGNYFSAGSQYSPLNNIEVNVYGGTVGTGFVAGQKSVVNISGGVVIGHPFRASPNSTVNIYGGVFSNFLTADEGSKVTLNGGEFRIDGEFVTGLEPIGANVQVNPPAGSVITGTLSDGTPFLFSPGRIWLRRRYSQSKDRRTSADFCW